MNIAAAPFSFSYLGLLPDGGQGDGPTFAFDFSEAKKAGITEGKNFEEYLVHPLIQKLIAKSLQSSVTFWITPLGRGFGVTVCSKADVDFFNPLHGLRGYKEYGNMRLNSNSSPFLHWNGNRVARCHWIPEPIDSTFIIADFGNAFGLSVGACDRITYQNILTNKVDNFDYLAIPSTQSYSVSTAGSAIMVDNYFCTQD